MRDFGTSARLLRASCVTFWHVPDITSLLLVYTGEVSCIVERKSVHAIQLVEPAVDDRTCSVSPLLFKVAMRIFCWNVNSLLPTVRNINLKYGSLAKFFAELDANIVCLQVQYLT